MAGCQSQQSPWDRGVSATPIDKLHMCTLQPSTLNQPMSPSDLRRQSCQRGGASANSNVGMLSLPHTQLNVFAWLKAQYTHGATTVVSANNTPACHLMWRAPTTHGCTTKLRTTMMVMTTMFTSAAKASINPGPLNLIHPNPTNTQHTRAVAATSVTLQKQPSPGRSIGHYDNCTVLQKQRQGTRAARVFKPHCYDTRTATCLYYHHSSLLAWVVG